MGRTRGLQEYLQLKNLSLSSPRTGGTAPLIRLALIRGDGIGVEVMESAKVVLRAVEKAYGAEFATIELDWSCERYHREGDTMPPTAWTAEPARRHVDRFLDRAFASRVAAAVREFFPGLHPDPVSLLTWVDRFSPDGRPLLGPAPSDARLVVAYGFSGSGFKFAAIMGEIAADFALNGSTGRDASSMAPNRYLLKPSTSR